MISSVSCCFILMISLFSPVAEISIVDDWAYARTVERLIATGTLRISEALEPSFVFQAYWSALFSYIFGFSFGVLRLSNFVMSLVGTLTFYLILKEFKVNKFLALLTTLFLLFNPLYFDQIILVG